MPLDISLDINLDDIVDDISDIALKQVPFAAQLALNETMFKSSVELKKVMPFFIEGGPVAFTKRGVQYTKAKSKRDLHTEIFIPDAQWKYMRWVIDGGTKRWSQSKHGIGVPVNVRLNKYGNIPGRKRKEAIWRSGLNKSESDIEGLGKNEFIGTVRGITGLWKRLGKNGRSKLQLKVSFSHDPASYNKGRFPFRKFAIKFAVKFFRRSFNKKLQQVIQRESRVLKVT